MCFGLVILIQDDTATVCGSNVQAATDTALKGTMGLLQSLNTHFVSVESGKGIAQCYRHGGARSDPKFLFTEVERRRVDSHRCVTRQGIGCRQMRDETSGVFVGQVTEEFVHRVGGLEKVTQTLK